MAWRLLGVTNLLLDTTFPVLIFYFTQINIALAILINLAIVFVVLNFLGKLAKLLGEGGIAVLRKVFGIILLSIAVKLFTSNVQHLI